MRNEHFLVDDQGAFAALKENLWFSEPFYGFSSLLNTKKKHLKRGAFSLVDDQGLEAGCHSQNEAKMSKKHAKSTRFESCAPIMPQNAPTKNPNKNPDNEGKCSWISSLYFCFD